MNSKISVLMSLYIKEKPSFFTQSLASVFSQSLLPDEVLIVVDGPITDDLQSIIDKYIDLYPEIMKVLPQRENKGLGISLAIGVKACRNNLIARMDTDDIMVPNRLELQLQEFIKNKDLVICGSNIAEFSESINNILSFRNVPETDQDIREFSKRRSPFNHMTVMYKRSKVLSVGNYLAMQGFEDYYLWARMLKSGYQGYNIQKNLVFARTGQNMYSRRGGLKYLKNMIIARYNIYKYGLGNFVDFISVVLIQTIVSMLPNKLRKFVYEKKLRN